MHFNLPLPSLLAATTLLLLLIHSTSACVHFSGVRSQSRPWENLDATLVDNGQTVCWYNSDYYSCGGPQCASEEWYFTCFQGNFAAIAILDPDGGDELEIEYSNPGGNFRFSAPPSSDGVLQDVDYDTWVYC